jgi:hypothetical protein
MKKLHLCLIVILFLYSRFVGAHNNSISFSEITLSSDHIQYDLRTIASEFITHAVSADDNGDQKLDDAELQNHKQEIDEYLNKRIKIQGPKSIYILTLDAMIASESGIPSVTFRMNFTPKNRKVGSFTISSKIFKDVQGHRSLGKITLGEEVQQFVFTVDNQYERIITDEDIDSYFLTEIGWLSKTVLGLVILIGASGVLWLVRRNFLTRPSLERIKDS